MMSLSPSTLFLECFLLFMLCLWFWPGTSRVLRLLAALLVGALRKKPLLLFHLNGSKNSLFKGAAGALSRLAICKSARRERELLPPGVV